MLHQTVFFVLTSGAASCRTLSDTEDTTSSTETCPTDGYIELFGGDSASWFYLCASNEDGNVYCHGREDLGLSPVLESANTITTPSDLLIGAPGGCGIFGKNGTVRCWGDAGETFPGLTEASDLAVGGTDFCVIGNDSTRNGRVYCWDARDPPGPEEPLEVYLDTGTRGEPWSQVEMDFSAVCAINRSNTLMCAGHASKPGRGDVLSMSGSYVDVAINQDGGICSVTTAGDVVCWDSWNASPSSELSGEDIFVEIEHTGVSGFCALSDEGKVICWGEALVPTAFLNDTGQARSFHHTKWNADMYCMVQPDSSILCSDTSDCFPIEVRDEP